MKKSTSRKLLLGLLALAQFMVVLDTSIMNVALPAVQKALNFSPTNLQWVITAYTLAVGGFLLLGGRAADLYGRRRVFMAGVATFTTASLAVALSNSETTMIIARGFQGLGAAFMSPAALSIVLTTFTEGKDRNRALSVWAAVAAGGAAAGVLLGGILTEYLGWRWNFLINIPVGLLVMWGALRWVPAHASEAEHRDLDLPGAALVTGGLMTLVYGLTKAPDWGWTDSTTMIVLGASALLLIGFIVNEARAKWPLVPLGIFKIRNLTGSNLTQLPITASMFAMFFFVSLYIQQVLGFSPVISGLSFLPVTFVVGITAALASRLVARIGYKPVMVIAPLFMGAGLLLLGGIEVGGSYLTDVFPGLALVAIGMGLSFVTITIAATSGVPQQQSGLASGILNTSQQIGGALGLAILSGVSATATKDYITSHLSATAPGLSPALVAEAAVQGYHSAFHVGVGFAVAASLAALVLVKARPVAKEEAAPVVAAH